MIIAMLSSSVMKHGNGKSLINGGSKLGNPMEFFNMFFSIATFDCRYARLKHHYGAPAIKQDQTYGTINDYMVVD